MPSLRIEIVTPESILFSGEAIALVARSTVGDFTVLAGHTATVGDIVPSVLRVQSSAGESSFAVHGGYFQVSSPEVGATLATVLAGVAEDVANIDVARAQAAKERAEADLAASGEDHAAHRAAQDALRRADLRLRAAAPARR